ncbi:MAG: 3'-5' exonuclease [Campylobacterales bacterium]|nr:3'-5' exonuclease [Campylobacterales bacterium]
MQKLFDTLTNAFRKNQGVLSPQKLMASIKKLNDIYSDIDTLVLVLEASGYPIEEVEGGFRLKTFFTEYKEQKFCVVDIETNGSKPSKSQVIEIGAVIVQNGEIIDKLDTFVYADEVPEYITKITNITQEDLEGAPSQKEALIMLREFMGDAIFVAHNVKFDYSFLNHLYNKHGLGSIGNQRFCTIDLARRSFEAPRYGLAYLNEILEIKAANHHRAYSDAYSAWVVMKKSFETIPEYVKSGDDVVKFSTSNRATRKSKAQNDTISQPKVKSV